MTQPPGAFLAPAEPREPDVVVMPSAVAQAQPSAVFALGEVLKNLVRLSRAFHSENDEDNAMNVIDKFVKAFASPSDMRALATGDQRAPKEDVSLRVPPGGAAVSIATGPVIDYSALAKALLDEQQRRGITQ